MKTMYEELYDSMTKKLEKVRDICVSDNVNYIDELYSVMNIDNTIGKVINIDAYKMINTKSM